jgi:ubiquinone/menaquinone biosynthesis C-methylase UbiE
MTFKDHFSSESPNYARFRPRYGRELFAYLAHLVSDHRLAWDCATGNGQAAVPLSEFFGRVIATDASEEQIRTATPNPRIEYRVAPAEKSTLEATSCDLITVAQAVHWFDLPAFYDEAKRVLKPDGLLAVWSYNLLRIDPSIDAIVNSFYTETIGPFWPPERKIVENGYRDLSFPFEEINAPEFSMTAEWSVDALLGYLRTWSASKRYLQEIDRDPVTLIESALRAAWPDNQNRLQVRWLLVIRLGRKPS